MPGINPPRPTAIYSGIVLTLTFCVLCGILVAGLWPFRRPSNQVRWLEKENGLAFGRHGSIASSGTFPPNNANGDKWEGLEIWLQPQHLNGQHTILSFDESEHPGAPFSIRQQKSSLIVSRHNVDDHGGVHTAWFEAQGIFNQDKEVLVTLALGPRDTSVYRDGELVAVAPILGTSENNFTGLLVLANAPQVNDSWSGQIQGVAIYHRQLGANEVRQHFENWTLNRSAGNEAPVAWYQFDEHQGNVVRNQIDPTTNFVIPAYYSILRPLFLSSLSRDYKATSSYWQSVGINIAGFIPLGFCGFAALTLFGSKRFAIAAMIALGFATSSTIEVLQWFLPTRSSGLTDIVTNTLGTAIGVALYRWPGTQHYLTRFFPTGTVFNPYVPTATRETSTETPAGPVSSKKIDVVETALSRAD